MANPEEIRVVPTKVMLTVATSSTEPLGEAIVCSAISLAGPTPSAASSRSTVDSVNAVQFV